MHISDGLLPPHVWIGGLAAAGAATGAAVRKFDERKVPQVAMLTSAFFVASLIHVPLGGASVHLLLTGLIGIVLGWLSIPSILVALFFQAILLGHGGLTTLGVNTVTMGSGAITSFAVFRALKGASGAPRRGAMAAFAATLLGVLAASAVFLLVLLVGGKELAPVAVAAIPQLAVSVLEALVTSSTVAFLLKVKPEMLEPGAGLRVPQEKPRGGARPEDGLTSGHLLMVLMAGILLLAPAPASAHGLEALARVEGGRVLVEAFFTDGAPAKGASVSVFELEGKGAGVVVLKGVADEDGRFSFASERRAAIRIVVEDSAGHRTELDLDERDGGRGAVSSKGLGFSRWGPVWVRIVIGIGAIGSVFALLKALSRRSRRRHAP